jgi:enoyl reductase-like protein
VDDLGDMTYKETIFRLIRLMYVAHEDRWLDLSLRNLKGDWLRLDQLPRSLPLSSRSILLQESSSWHHKDKSYFLNIVQRSDQKPAPFTIPTLDNNFEVWFEKVWFYIRLSTKYT